MPRAHVLVPHAGDTNYQLALTLWGIRTLLKVCDLLHCEEPRRSQFEDLATNLAPFPASTDVAIGAGRGLHISKDTLVTTSHRHYSHMLPCWNTGLLDWDKAESRRLCLDTLDNWHAGCNKGACVTASPDYGTATCDPAMVGMVGVVGVGARGGERPRHNHHHHHHPESSIDAVLPRHTSTANLCIAIRRTCADGDFFPWTVRISTITVFPKDMTWEWDGFTYPASASYNSRAGRADAAWGNLTLMLNTVWPKHQLNWGCPHKGAAWPGSSDQKCIGAAMQPNTFQGENGASSVPSWAMRSVVPDGGGEGALALACCCSLPAVTAVDFLVDGFASASVIQGATVTPTPLRRPRSPWRPRCRTCSCSPTTMTTRSAFSRAFRPR